MFIFGSHKSHHAIYPLVFGASIIKKTDETPKTPLALPGFALYFPSCSATAAVALKSPSSRFSSDISQGVHSPVVPQVSREPGSGKSPFPVPFVPYPTISTPA